MTVTEIFQRVGSVLAGRHNQRAASYDDLVAAVADGKPVDAESLADLLESLGKSEADFQGDVQELLKRREWAERFHGMAGTQRKIDTLNGERTAENRRHAEAIEAETVKHKAAVDAFEWRRMALEKEMGLSKEAQQSLIRTSPFFQEYQRAVQRHGAVREALDQMKTDYRKRSTNFESTRETLSGDQVAAMERQLATLQAEIDARQPVVDQAEAAVQRLEAKLTEV